MIEAKTILAAVKSGAALTEGVQNSLSGQFTSGVDSQALSGSDSASAVTGQCSQSCKTMMANMDKTFAALKADLQAYQQMQQQELPQNFTTHKNDLREKPARGFPDEDPGYHS